MKFRHVWMITALACIVWSMTACSVTVGPDGSKSATLDGQGAAAVITATK